MATLILREDRTMRPLKLFLLLALAAAGPLEAQGTGRISGTVRNTEGQPIASATVIVRGTRLAAQTAPDGRYLLPEVPVGSYTVVASLIGYGFATTTATVAPGQALQLDFSLEARAVQLEGVTVVGYGTQEKRTVTGAVSTLIADQLVETPTFNAIKAIQNRLPGVDVTNAGNKPGDQASIRIRGVRSITANNDPLIVVDGVPIAGRLDDLDPNNIVSMDVLKDAASTAIYGSRGANGVILVTTKGGGTGGVLTEFRVGMSYAGQSAYGLPTYMNNDQYVQQLQDAAAYAGVSTNPQNLLNNVAYAAYQAGQHTDWQNLIAQTGYQKNVQIGMSGISGTTRFNLSGNYFDQTGTAVGLEFNRGTGMASIDHTQGRLRLGVTGNFTHSLQTVNGGDGLWGAARQQTGFGLPRDSTGALITNPDGDPLAYNPLKLVEGRVSQNRRDRLFASAFAQFDLFSGVNLRVNFGPDYTQASTGDFTGADVQFGGASYRTASYNQNTNFQYILDNMLQINRDIGISHHVDATLLYGIQKSRYTFGNESSQHIPYDEALYYAIGQGDNYQATSGLSETALESYMGRLVYTFQDKYTVMGAVRRDGSSVLAPGHKWTTFPTVGVAWQLGDESFMQGLGWLSSLKLRGSYGKTGNAAITAYQTQGALQNGKINFGAVTAPAYYPNTSNPANPDLGWEKTAKTDAAVDFGLFGNRVTGSVDWYRENTSDLLLTRSLPGTSGYTSALQNIGSTRNSGVEVQLSSVNLNNPHGLQWRTEISWAHNKNEITGLAFYSDTTLCPKEAPRCDANNGWFVGQPINTGGQTDPLNANGAFVGDAQRRVWYDYKQLGVWQLGEETEAAVYGSKPGQIHIQDTNGDGIINALDRVLQGNTYPKWTASIYNSFKFRSFDLSVLANIRWGYSIWNTFIPSLYGRYGQMVTSYWTPTNADNVNPSPNLGGIPISYGNSRGYIDGSHWRIRQVQFGYTLSPEMATRLRMKSLRIYATATEPYVHYQYDYFDPESGYAGGSPVYRTLLVGADVIF
jgi:TonB-linked SusC/RagA family outer membrane protein